MRRQDREARPRARRAAHWAAPRRARSEGRADPVNYFDPSGLKLRYACVGGEGAWSCGWVDDGAGSLRPGDVTGTSNARPNDSGNAGNASQPAQPGRKGCTSRQIAAQKIGEGIGAGGIKGARVGKIIQKGGAAVGLGSAALLQPEGVLVGGEIAGLGSTIKAVGYGTAVVGYGIALAGGADVRRELNDAAVRLIPFSGFFSDNLKNRIKAGLNRAEDAAGLNHTGCGGG